MKSKNVVLICVLFFHAFKSSAQWTTLCSTGNGFVDNFEIYNGELYATGFFTNVCSNSVNYLVKWDGTNWLTVGNGFVDAGHHLQTVGNDLFSTIYQPNVDSNWLYKFDGTQFNRFGEGVYLSNAVPGFSQTANLYNVIEYDSSLIVCDEFDRVGNKNLSGIIKWTGSEWDSLGGGLLGNIPGTAPVMYPHDMCIYGNDLVVSGNFKFAGGQIVNGIARWDGTNWYPFGQGMNSTVYSICVYNGELYAGGDFTMAGTNSINYIAKWNGSDWVSPGFSLFYISPSDYTFIHTMKVINNKLFISGGFDRALAGTDTMLCSAIAAFDGINIDTLSGGIPGKEVEAIALYNGSLIAGGGLFGSSYIAQYDLTNSTQEIDQHDGIVISPNPSQAHFQIQSENNILEVLITDVFGRLIQNIKANEKNADIRIDDSGIYFVSIKTEKSLITKRVIVNN